MRLVFDPSHNYGGASAVDDLGAAGAEQTPRAPFDSLLRTRRGVLPQSEIPFELRFEADYAQIKSAAALNGHCGPITTLPVTPYLTLPGGEQAGKPTILIVNSDGLNNLSVSFPSGPGTPVGQIVPVFSESLVEPPELGAQLQALDRALASSDWHWWVTAECMSVSSKRPVCTLEPIDGRLTQVEYHQYEIGAAELALSEAQ